MPAIVVAIVLLCVVIVAGASGLHTILEHERGVVLRLGRRSPVLAPGLHFILPFGIDRLVRVDLRSTVLRLPPREVMTADGVPVTLTAAVHLQVVNALLAVTRVVDYRASCVQLAHAALLDVASRLPLRTLITDQATVRDELGRFVDERAEPWGVQVTAIDLKDIELPEALRTAMEQEAAAAADERSRGRVAAAELEAARRLVDAARVLAEQPYAVQLRYLQALTEMSDSNRSMVVVPLPVELVQPFVNLQGHAAPGRLGAAGAQPAKPGAGAAATEADADPAG
jgi:regulator of protease activity HflC (stomatin/prohibitin superfamily)